MYVPLYDVPFDGNLAFRFTLGERSWELDLHTIVVDEQVQLRKLTGLRWLDMLAEFETLDGLAVKALVWLARKRAGDNVPFDSAEMNFPMPQLRGGLVVEKLVPALADDSAAEEAPADAVEDARPDPTEPAAKRKTRRTS